MPGVKLFRRVMKHIDGLLSRVQEIDGLRKRVALLEQIERLQYQLDHTLHSPSAHITLKYEVERLRFQLVAFHGKNQ